MLIFYKSWLSAGPYESSSFEKGMTACFCSRNSMFRDPLKASVNEICSIFDILLFIGAIVDLSHQSHKVDFTVVLIPLEKLNDRLLTDFLQLSHLRVGRHTLDLSLLKHLEAFSVTWEKRSAGDELEKDATHGPYIDAAVVLV